MLFLLVFFSYSNAQVAGTTRSASYQLSFSKEFNNVTLDPSPNIGSASRVEFLNTFSLTARPDVFANDIISDILGVEGIDIPDWLFDLARGASFMCFDINPVFNCVVYLKILYALSSDKPHNPIEPFLLSYPSDSSDSSN